MEQQYCYHYNHVLWNGENTNRLVYFVWEWFVNYVSKVFCYPHNTCYLLLHSACTDMSWKSMPMSAEV